MKITIKHKTESHEAEVEPTDTVAQLKEKVQQVVNIPPDEQRVIYRGRLLKDAEVLGTDVKLEDGQAIHLVRKPPAAGGARAVGETPAPQAGTTPAPQTTTPPVAPTMPAGNPQDLQGLFNSPGMQQFMGSMAQAQPTQGAPGGAPGMMGMDMQGMMGLLQNPVIQQQMQALMSNPALLQQMMQNPMVTEVLQRDPQIRDSLDNPELLQTVAQMARQMGMGAGGGAPRPDQMAAMMGGFPGLGGLGAMGAMGGMGGMGGAPAPVADPATHYASQLETLAGMGFTDRETLITLLQDCGGNVNLVIDRLMG